MTVSADLVAFLRGRLDDDEAAARGCESPPPWSAATHGSDSWIVTDADGDPLIYDEGTPSLAEAAHIARHDPARVLREVEAKRAIVEHAEFWSENDQDAMAWVLRALAAVYSDHPDYQPGWKP